MGDICRGNQGEGVSFNNSLTNQYFGKVNLQLKEFLIPTNKLGKINMNNKAEN